MHRNRIYILLMAVSSIWMSSFAQVQIGTVNMPVGGDTFGFTTTANLPDGLDPSLTGENMTWDYSELSPLINDVDTFFLVSETPPLFQFFFNNEFIYPDYAADYARKEMDVNLGLVTISDAFSYFKNDNEGLRNVGFGANINGVPASVQNIPIDWVYEFPLNYLDESSSFSASELEVPTLGYYHHEQDREVMVEGWGTLILPSGSYDVLKVKMVVNATDSIYIETPGTGFAIEQPEETIYQWLSPSEIEPVLQISQQIGFGMTIRYKHDEAISVEEIEQAEIKVFPNPVSGLLKVQSPKASISSYAIFDARGKLVLRKRIVGDELSQEIPVYSFSRGEYFILFEIDGQSYYSSFFKE